jgi:hypothetical protein
VDLLGNYGAYYPFATNQQSFEPKVASRLQKSANDFTPVYIRCGRQACCDYLYFYVRHSHNGEPEFICNICDAKHTSAGRHKTETITPEEQTKLLRAVAKVTTAVNATKIILRDVRLLFVSNRNGLPKSNLTAANVTAQSLSPGVEQELPNGKENTLGKNKTATTISLITAILSAQSLFPGVKLEVLNNETFEFGPFSDILLVRRGNEKHKEKSPAIKNFIEGNMTENDVLMGRGGRSNLGNARYLEATRTIQPRYRNATKEQKMGISQELVDIVNKSGGRFLRLDNASQRWYEVDNLTARTKASQTLYGRFPRAKLAQGNNTVSGTGGEIG